jgi:hypothetical protein
LLAPSVGPRWRKTFNDGVTSASPPLAMTSTTYIDSMLRIYPERSRNEIVDDLLEATETCCNRMGPG